MAGNPATYKVIWPLNCPADVDVGTWQGNVPGLLNEIPSDWWNDLFYGAIKTETFLMGQPQPTALTGSHWIDYKGNAAITFDITFDPINIAEVLAILTGAAAVVFIGLDAAIASFNPPVAAIIALLIAAGLFALMTPVVMALQTPFGQYAIIAAGLAVVAIGGILAYKYATSSEARKNINEAAGSVYEGGKKVAKEAYGAMTSMG